MTRSRLFPVLVSAIVIVGGAAVPARATPILSGVPTSLNTTEGIQTIGFSFTDSTAGPYTVDFNWGDGTPDTTIGVSGFNQPISISSMHRFEEGSDTVTLTVTDSASVSASANFLATFSEVPVSGVPPGSIFSGFAAGTPLSVGFIFADPGGAEPLSDYTATMTWGDGTTPSAATITPFGPNQFLAMGTHTYTTGGTFAIAEDINHEGLVTVDSGSVLVAGSTTTVPEPTSLTLLGIGLCASSLIARRRRPR